MTTKHPQLPLGIGLKDSATFENFLPTGNELLLEALQSGNDDTVYLWGPAGSGKTHLLQAVSHASATKGEAPAYLPFADLVELSPAILEGLEQQAVITVDDVHLVAGRSDWEEALFHLYNRVREAGHRIVVSATAPPNESGIKLPDLVTRLGWGPIFRLESLDDTGKRHALQLRANLRGMTLTDEVSEYLLRRCPRDMGSLFSLLDRLDQASLVAQRKLTIPFVRDVIQ